MLNGRQLRRVMDGAIAVVVVADHAVEHVVAEDAIKCFHLGGGRLADLVGTLIPSETSVAQARTRRPSTSTMQASHV